MTNLCPACINDFLKTHELDELGDELIHIHNPGEDVSFQLCSLHTRAKKNLVIEITKAKAVTKDLYNKTTNSHHVPYLPSQDY